MTHSHAHRKAISAGLKRYHANKGKKKKINKGADAGTLAYAPFSSGMFQRHYYAMHDVQAKHARAKAGSGKKAILGLKLKAARAKVNTSIKVSRKLRHAAKG